MGARRWKHLGVIGAAPPPPLDSRLRGNYELGGRNDENAEWRVQWRAGTPRRRIFVPNRSEPDFILLAALGQPKATFAAPGVTIPLPSLSSHTCIAVKSNH